MDALIDAKVAAAEARTDSKFAAVLAKLDVLGEEIRSVRAAAREDARSSRGLILTSMFAVMALIIALAALAATLAPASFSAGLNMRELAREEARAAATERAQPASAGQTSSARR